MTRSESPGLPPASGPERTGRQQPPPHPVPGPSILARATRLLIGVADEADDTTLLSLLGPVVVPALGDVAALYTIGPDGTVALAGAEPAQNGLVRRLRGHLQEHPDAASGYAALAAQGRPAIVRVPASNDLVGEPAGAPGTPSPSRILGLVAEIVAPLGSGAEHDALLAIGSVDRARQYGDAHLATVEVLAALVAGRRAVRALVRHAAHLRQQIEESALAGRELAHRLNNDLTMPVGVVELLLDRGPLGSDLQEMLEAASKDLAALEEHIKAFHEQMRSQSSAPAGPHPPERYATG